jgi:hypothetical protein
METLGYFKHLVEKIAVGGASLYCRLRGVWEDVVIAYSKANVRLNDNVRNKKNLAIIKNLKPLY